MKAVIVAPGEGRFIAVGSTGAGVTVKASAEETGGLCSVWEGRIEPGTVGAAPHYHRERDEFFYLLEGELVLRLGDENHVAKAGAFAFVPRETIHGFHNAGNSPARGLVMHHPAGFEHYIKEAQQLALRGGSSEDWAALHGRFDLVPVPPDPEV